MAVLGLDAFAHPLLCSPSILADPVCLAKAYGRSGHIDYSCFRVSPVILGTQPSRDFKFILRGPFHFGQITLGRTLEWSSSS